jgi:hypothetical protein
MPAGIAGHCGHLLSLFAFRGSVVGRYATRIHTAMSRAKVSDEDYTESHGRESAHSSICALILEPTRNCVVSEAETKDRATALPYTKTAYASTRRTGATRWTKFSEVRTSGADQQKLSSIDEQMHVRMSRTRMTTLDDHWNCLSCSYPGMQSVVQPLPRLRYWRHSL